MHAQAQHPTGTGSSAGSHRRGGRTRRGARNTYSQHDHPAHQADVDRQATKVRQRGSNGRRERPGVPAPRGGMSSLSAFANAVSTKGNARLPQVPDLAQYYARFGTHDQHRQQGGGVPHRRACGSPASRRTTVTSRSPARWPRRQGLPHHDRAATATTARTCRRPRRTWPCPPRWAAVLTVAGLDTTSTPTSRTSSAPTLRLQRRLPQRAAVLAVLRPGRRPSTRRTTTRRCRSSTVRRCPTRRAATPVRSSAPPTSRARRSTAPASRWPSPTPTGPSRRPSPVTPAPYAVRHGDGGYGPGQLTQAPVAGCSRGGHCGPSGWYGEETLDVEAVHAMAPGANIRYYASASCFDDDFIDTLGRVVDEDVVQLVSNSWGDVAAAESRDAIAAYETVFLQGASEGISFMYSSGDNGDEVQHTGIRQADYPTSDPYVTSVGGTSTGIGSNGQPVVRDRLGHPQVHPRSTASGRRSVTSTVPAAVRPRCSTSRTTSGASLPAWCSAGAGRGPRR